VEAVGGVPAGSAAASDGANCASPTRPRSQALPVRPYICQPMASISICCAPVPMSMPQRPRGALSKLGVPMTAAPPLHPVHEDPYLLVLDKPAGLLCVPGRGEDKQDCLSTRAQLQWPDALIVHRLDMGTSGLVVMARGTEMQRALSAAFAERRVHKRYEAVVDGALPLREDWSLIDAPLMADWPRRPLQKVDPEGKPSVTRWKALSLPSGEPAATHVLLGWIGVVSWTTAGIVQGSASSRLQGSVSVKRRPVGLEHARLAALDAFARHQEHRHHVDAVAVRAFRRRPADAVGGVDAELVRLDRPRLLAPACEHTRPARPAAPASGRGDDVGCIGSNQRCMPPCSALYSTGCQCARCGTCAARRLRRRSTSGGGAGSGRRPSGRCRAAGRSRRRQRLQLRQLAAGQRRHARRAEHRVALRAQQRRGLAGRGIGGMQDHGASLTARGDGIRGLRRDGAPPALRPRP
jgi:tRNA pseudouridine32 synthase/23S rRNA pseudouridine746 synthase